MLKLAVRMILVGALIAVAFPVVSLILPSATSIAFADDPHPCHICRR
jgi:hypothetical protein